MGPRDNKKSLLRSSTNPREYYDPSIAFGLPPLGLDKWGAGDNKKSLLRSSTNPQDYYDPSKAFGLPPLGLDCMGSRRQ